MIQFERKILYWKWLNNQEPKDPTRSIWFFLEPVYE